MDVWVKPAVGVLDVLRVDGEAGGQSEAPLLGGRTEPIQVWPGSLRIHVVGGDGRDASPVVDPRIEQHAEVVRQVRRSLKVDLWREDQTG